MELNLKKEFFNEKRFAYAELSNFFEIESEDGMRKIKKYITCKGTDSGYYNFTINGTIVMFCLLKKELGKYSDTFKNIDFFYNEEWVEDYPVSKQISLSTVLDCIPEEVAQLFVVQLGKLTNDRH